MRPFLARLVDRVHGTARRLEPLIAPQFAPADSPGAGAIPEATREADLHASAPAVGQPAPARPNARDATQPERQTPPVHATPQRAEIVRERLLVPHFIEREHAATAPAESAIHETTAQPPEVQTRAQSSVQKFKRGGMVRETARALLDSPSAHVMAAQANAETPPTIRVTIGRIDVRAVQPPAPPARKAPPAAPPSLTLDAYLSSRRKGAR